MNIAICDDSSIDRDIIVDLLNLYFSGKSVVYKTVQYGEGTNLIHDVEEGSVYDIIFLDIFLEKQLGIDIARKLRRIPYNGMIVFLTASSDYAVDSYDVNASGYLLKPHSFEKLCAVMDRILENYDINTYTIRHRNTLIRVPYNDILYVESSNNKCILHCVNGEEHVIYKKLCDIEKELDDSRFLRCHQSYLVNMNHIQRAEEQFTLFTGDVIMIRQKSLKDIREKYMKYIGHQK